MNRKDILQKNLGNVCDRIESACSRVNRNPDGIRLIAVTKYVDSNTVREMVDLGLHDFGENRIQVAEPKLNDLANLPIRWHWIGNLQTNKVRKVLGRFQEFHSIDRIPLIEAIDERLINHPEETDDETCERHHNGHTYQRGIRSAFLCEIRPGPLPWHQTGRAGGASRRHRSGQTAGASVPASGDPERLTAHPFVV